MNERILIPSYALVEDFIKCMGLMVWEGKQGLKRNYILQGMSYPLFSIFLFYLDFLEPALNGRIRLSKGSI